MKVYTDDTQMSLSFVESLMKHGNLEKGHIINLWTRLAESNWFDEANQPLKGPFQV